MSKIKFINNGSSLFSKDLRNRVNQYFGTTSKEKVGDFRLFLKAILLIVSALSIYVFLVFFSYPAWLGIILSVIFGCNLAGIGFNIMHDAGHDTFSANKKVNRVFSYSLNLLGGSIFFWKLKHNIAHHTYTNVQGHDHDIDVKFMRLHDDQPFRWYHRFQYIYFILLYSISYMAWVFYQDYEKYFRGTMNKGGESFRFPTKEKAIFWITKVFHLGIFIVLPVCFAGWQAACIGLAIAFVSCGLCLAFVFQLAHVVGETHFPTVKEHEDIKEEWMVHQLETTANFSTNNKLLSWLLGGLNYQVEHHLFPKISHIHYPEINKLVKQTCKDHGIGYIEFKSLGQAVWSHIRHIHKMSVNA
ncbi:fatty acid desaturase family protein [Sphingobacterium spiritivorum]|uniref:fatty acid desaturase family protein n=1 Tax=Sphingobacterium spiritivorum TaxID=258 RepID=UPI003DA386B4